MAFSLRSLFVGVAFLAVFAVSLIFANDAWLSVSMTVIYLVLVVAILGAIHCGPPWRTFWNGFAIAGWAYFIILTGDVLTFVGQPQNLVTTMALDAVHAQVARYETLPPDHSPGDPATFRIIGTHNDGSPIYAVPVPSRSQFRQVGHNFFAVIAGVLGGFISLCFSDKRRTRSG
ncbi:MAG: hypothetical protein WD894_25300 [Pirellulales bacterium]